MSDQRDRYELDAPPVRRVLDEAAEIAERMHRDYVRLGHLLNHELHGDHLRCAADDWTTEPSTLVEWAEHWNCCDYWIAPPRQLPSMSHVQLDVRGETPAA